MATIRVNSRDLLEFNARYGVLICLDCQYAIQKSAIKTHLLRHKVYRDEKQRLLSRISRFDILEPDKVSSPAPGSVPVHGLPVHLGYRCTVTDCGHLCVSSKRMERHWSTIHSDIIKDQDKPSKDLSCQPATFQTFFRGNKIKYFEVAPSTTTTDLANITTSGSQPANISELTAMQDKVIEQPDGDKTMTETSSEVREMDLNPPAPQSSVPSGFDMEAFVYFHHFMTSTSSLLPEVVSPFATSTYWQQTVIRYALQMQWLMNGVLALASCHMSILSMTDVEMAKTHLEKSMIYTVKFREHFVGQDLTVQTGTAIEIARQIECILSCCFWSLNQPLITGQVDDTIPEIDSLIMALRSIFDYDYAKEQSSPVRNDDIFMQANTILNAKPGAKQEQASRLPPIMINHLRELPETMAEAIGRPGPGIDLDDVISVLQAIAALVECCETSFVTYNQAVAFRGMALWMVRIPPKFHKLLCDHHPAALVVLAYWATILVGLAEVCDCWFLPSLAGSINMHVVALIPLQYSKLHDLLANLSNDSACFFQTDDVQDPPDFQML